MTIKQQGGIFGRNPSFNDVEVETIDVAGSASVGSLTSTGTYTLDMNGTNDLFYIDATGAANYQGTYKLNSNRGFAGNILGSVLAQWNGTDVAQVRFEAGSDEANQDNGRIILRTSNAGGTLVDGLEVDESQNVLVNNGNLVISTSGKGIDFSATSGTGTSELFDDYEEGTYDASFYEAGGSTLISVTGDYTKVGNVVTVHAQALGGTTGGSNQIRSNLPFPVKKYVSNTLAYSNASGGMLVALGTESSSYLVFQDTIGNISSANRMLGSDVSSSTRVYFNLTYICEE